MSVIGVRHETRREGEDCGPAGLEFLIRLNIRPRVGWIAAQLDEGVNAAVALLKGPI